MVVRGGRRELRIDGSHASSYRPGSDITGSVWDAIGAALLALPRKKRPRVALLGLGPGLTPSGDDFLGGMLIALATLPAPSLRAQLLELIENHAQQRTNAISIAHLRAAGAGAGHEALHDTLNSLLGGDPAALPAQLTAIDHIGHSSGWDALAGTCVTLRAYLAVQRVGV